MKSMFTNPEKYVIWFNMAHPNAYRQITTEDIENLKSCELICRYGFYSTSQDSKTIMGIIKYEQMLYEKSEQKSAGDKVESPRCKMCGKPLPTEPEVKGGRPREYCSECELLRGTDRQKELRHRRRKHSLQ